MSLHNGKPRIFDDVRIDTPILESICSFPTSDDVKREMIDAIDWAVESESVYYFSVFYHDALVGQIYLHDIGCEPRTAMIGYHLFHPQYRGKGIGTKALRLLKDFASGEMGLQTLIVITGSANMASRSIAEKNDFACLGGAREDPENLVVFRWTQS